MRQQSAKREDMDRRLNGQQADASLTISIVTPCLNDASRLSDSLASVGCQNYPSVEHIVVDGGSTDGSLELLRRHETRLAWWCSEADDGHGHALWKGFRRARGEVLGWLCSSDLLLPGALEAVAQFFSAHPHVDWAVGHGLVIDDHSRVVQRLWALPYTVRRLMYWRVWAACQPAVFFRRSAFDRAGGIDASRRVSVDTDLFLRLARQSRPAVIRRFLAAIRLHDDSQSNRLADEVAAADEALRRQAGMPDRPPWLRRLLRRGYDWRFGLFRGLMDAVHPRTPYPRGLELTPATWRT